MTDLGSYLPLVREDAPVAVGLLLVMALALLL